MRVTSVVKDLIRLLILQVKSKECWPFNGILLKNIYICSGMGINESKINFSKPSILRMHRIKNIYWIPHSHKRSLLNLLGQLKQFRQQNHRLEVLRELLIAAQSSGLTVWREHLSRLTSVVLLAINLLFYQNTVYLTFTTWDKSTQNKGQNTDTKLKEFVPFFAWNR